MYSLDTFAFTLSWVYNKLVAPIEVVGHIEGALLDCRVGKAVYFGGRAGRAVPHTDSLVDAFGERSREVDVRIGTGFVEAAFVVVGVSGFENVIILVKNVGTEECCDDDD